MNDWRADCEAIAVPHTAARRISIPILQSSPPKRRIAERARGRPVHLRRATSTHGATRWLLESWNRHWSSASYRFSHWARRCRRSRKRNGSARRRKSRGLHPHLRPRRTLNSAVRAGSPPMTISASATGARVPISGRARSN